MEKFKSYIFLQKLYRAVLMVEKMPRATTYRGFSLEQLQKMSMDQFIQLLAIENEKKLS